MMDKISAGVILSICLVMLLRLVLGDKSRRVLDAAALRAWARGVGQWRRTLHWWSSRRYAASATRDAIRRARAASSVARDGNVYRPESFRDPRKPH
jgi:hypothetical protein